MAKTRIVTQGKLSSRTTLREVLWTILKDDKSAVGILRIEAANKRLEGDVCIQNSIFVVGASTKVPKSSGYEALKMLLHVRDGSFQYLDYSNADIPISDLQQGLKIRRTQLINRLPNLPARLEEIMGANTLNKMRGYTPEKEAGARSQSGKIEKAEKEASARSQSGNIEKAEKSSRKKPHREEALIDKDTLDKLAQWERKSLHLRAAALWGLCIFVSAISFLMYLTHK